MRGVTIVATSPPEVISGRQQCPPDLALQVHHSCWVVLREEGHKDATPDVTGRQAAKQHPPKLKQAPSTA